MVKTVLRLERALEAWEDIVWFVRLVYKMSGQDPNVFPPVVSLREALRHRRSAYDICEMLNKQRELPTTRNNIFGLLSDMAADLSDWSRESRRVYRLSKSLADMLAETNLPELSPKEIKTVAPSFVVMLDSPITMPSGTVHDFIVASHAPADDDEERVFMSFRSYSQGFDRYEPLTQVQREAIRTDLMTNRGSLAKHRARFEASVRSLGLNGFWIWASDETSFDTIIKQEEVEREDREFLFQMCMGVNLYLQTARVGDTETRHTISALPTKRGQSLMQGAGLFDLAVSQTFSRPSHHKGDPTGREQNPQFRRGSWRRPRGLGHDPDASRTEWYWPYWTKLDQIAAGIQPTGSVQRVRKL